MIRRRADIDLGILKERVALGDHIAYLWERPEQFARAVGFLEVGLRGRDHCVIFGHDDANAAICDALRARAFDPETLAEEGRLTRLGGAAAGDLILADIAAIFQRAIDCGAPLVRLLGNIGWGRPGWPSDPDLLAFEAKVTDAVRALPAVVVCMYDVRALSGPVCVHGAYETHPLTICGNVLRENPYFVPAAAFLAALGSADEVGGDSPGRPHWYR